MNLLPVMQDSIFEFQIDQNLVLDYLGMVKSDKNIIYNHTGNISKVDRSEYIKYGYPVPNCEKLFSQLQNAIDVVSTKKFGEKNQTISDIWITKSSFLQRTDKHFHSHSIFSGILYLQDHSSQTIFYPEDTFYNIHKNSMVFVNVLPHKQEIVSDTKLGKLLIFPSYLFHSVPVIKSKEVRYTLAFNTFFTGKISTFPTQMLESIVTQNFIGENNER